MATITMIPVDSQAIRAIGYRDRVLRIEFLESGLYEYDNVPPDVAQDFLDAPSKGRYFDRHIRNDYEMRKIR